MTEGVAVGVGVTREARDLGVGVGVAVGVGVGVENVSSSSDNNDSVSITCCDDVVDDPTDFVVDESDVDAEVAVEVEPAVTVGVG